MNTSQGIKMKMVDDNVGNQVRHNAVQNDGNEYRNRNVVTEPSEGNGNGINGNLIRCYNYQKEGHYASNCTVKPRKQDADYLQQQLRIAQEEEAWIQSNQEEFKFMAAADAYEETERIKVNCTLEDTLQQASTSGIQSDNAPVYDLDGSTEVPRDENCYDHDIFNMLTHEVQYTDLQTELDHTKEKLENCTIRKEKEYVVLVIGTQNVKNANMIRFCMIKLITTCNKRSNDCKLSWEISRHKDLEFEIERLLRAVVSQDIMSIVQNLTVVETSDLQTELERTKERFKNCIINKENEYAKL
nr:hypothetical protein [Tanacetum cinerariifolium]